jgi:hypothetical protein
MPSIDIPSSSRGPFPNLKFPSPEFSAIFWHLKCRKSEKKRHDDIIKEHPYKTTKSLVYYAFVLNIITVIFISL